MTKSVGPDLEARTASVRPGPSGAMAALGFVGLAVFVLALVAVQPGQFNVVTYASVETEGARYLPAMLFAGSVLVVMVALAGWAGRSAEGHRRILLSGSILAPLILSAPVACYAFVDAVPPFASSLLMLVSAGWAALRAGDHLKPVSSWRWAHPVALGSVMALIIILTLVHTRLQIDFFEHFMLGHADIGHHAEELKNCLAGRGLRCDSFDNVRLGIHFSPLLYALVPGYALWPTPVYLMVCSVVLIHLVAVPAYYLARGVSGSTLVAWMFAVAWLLLPSQSRLVYANTYGFQGAYVTMPLLGVMIAAGVLGRWRTSLVMVVLVLLCRETAAAATFGWGLYMALCTPRRKTGIVVAVGSLVYVILCVKVFIPLFAAEGRYWRLDLFGELGGTLGELLLSPLTRPDVFFGRLLRGRVLFLLLVLLVPMALLPLRGWRIALASLPTLLLVVLIEERDQLNIKFWHQASVLPFLFFGGIASLSRVNKARRGHTEASRGLQPARSPEKTGAGDVPSAAPILRRRSLNTGLAAAALICAAWGHYFYGFSPIAKPYEPIAKAGFLDTPDPRMETVRRLRAMVPKDRTILATERLAAHFTDYRRLYTGSRSRQADFVIVDQADTWDTSGLVDLLPQFAENPDYRLYGVEGSIVILQRKESARPVSRDD